MGRFWLPVVVVVAAVAGCTSTSAPPPAATPPPTTSSAAPDKAAAVAWVDQVCAADKSLFTVTAVVAKAPKFGPGEATEADRAAVLASLTELRDLYARAKAAYDAVGPSPISRGDELVSGHRKGLAELVAKLQGYLDKAQVFPAPRLDAPLTLAGLDAVTWQPEGPGLGELRDAEPVLAEAHKEASNCR